MSPIGSLQLTAEECNEILMKRAVAAVQANNQHTITTSQASDGHNARKFYQQQMLIFRNLNKIPLFSNFNSSAKSFTNT